MADVPFEGIFRRQIDLRRWDAGTVVGWLEDESHHFGITLVHEGGRISDLRMQPARYPWTTCAEAGTPLRGLIGQPLVARCSAIGAMIEMERNCTHLFDLAGLVVAHAHSGREHRRYHGMVVPLADIRPGAPEGHRRVVLHRDGQPVLAWELDDETIRAPAAYAGRSILQGFRRWTESLPEAQAEEALVLRRVAYVSQGRRISIEAARVAADMQQDPVCHSFQPGIRDRGFRVGNTNRRFDDRPEAMLSLIGSKP